MTTSAQSLLVRNARAWHILKGAADKMQISAILTPPDQVDLPRIRAALVDMRLMSHDSSFSSSSSSSTTATAKTSDGPGASRGEGRVLNQVNFAFRNLVKKALVRETVRADDAATLGECVRVCVCIYVDHNNTNSLSHTLL